MTKKDINQVLATTAVSVMLESTQNVLGEAVDDLDMEVMNAVYEVRESIDKAMDIIAEYRERVQPVFMAACDKEESKC